MTPDWMHQALWFISGIFATGAFWYFLSQKNYHAAIWTGYAALVLALLAVALLIRNDVIRREPGQPFRIRFHTALVAKYPGPLIYVYESKIGKRIAPVGYAVVLEIINNRATVAKVHDYLLDIDVNNEWRRLPNLQALNPGNFYWVNNGSLQACTRLDFTGTSFDFQARRSTLQPGESIKGWMFFEWTPELRDSDPPRIQKLRIQIENAHGEHQSETIDTDQQQEPGASSLPGGAWSVPPQEKKTDLSSVPILPYMDLLRGFRDGTIK